LCLWVVGVRCGCGWWGGGEGVVLGCGGGWGSEDEG